jgi:hypothetical protein
MPSVSRTTQSNGVSGETSAWVFLPFMVNVVIEVPPLEGNHAMRGARRLQRRVAPILFAIRFRFACS